MKFDGKLEGKLEGKLVGKFGGNCGGRLGNIPDSSLPPLLFLGPLLLPKTSTTGRGFGLPSPLSTIAGLCAYFLRWSFSEWQYFVA